MERLVINGGNKLNGQVKICGMKNSALPIIFATILVKEECVIGNIPLVSDVLGALDILKEMGASVSFIDTHTVSINTKKISEDIKGFGLISKMRASSYLMGAMLARFGKAYLPMPGGCNFGKRPIEQHLKGFTALGAECYENDGYVSLTTKSLLKSTKITLDKISVGATINIVLSSVFLDGITVIDNVAIEPHVDDLICFLNSAGAKIVRKNRRIYCEGVKRLHSVSHQIYPDMIEALTYITFLGVTGGEISLICVNCEHLSYLNSIFCKMGFNLSCGVNTQTVKISGKLNGFDVITAPYPHFPTDLHPQFASLLLFTKNGGIIKEEIFPTRFAYVNELSKMGARIVKEGNSVIVMPSILHSATTDATDLRAGASLVCAALGTKGESTINNVNYIVRGYEDLVGKITSLGGKIKLIKGE